MRLRWVITAAWLLLLLSVGGGCLSPTAKRTRYTYNPDYGAEDPQFLRSLQALRTGIRPGNQARLLENGDALWADMFDALRAARHSINIETYIFSDGKLSRELTEILCERARAGVAVHMLVDAWGARAPLLEAQLQAAGVRYRIYKPIRLYALYHIEDRTHRKLVIVDGRIGYCGGFCFDDRWLGDARNPKEWRELTVRMEGPVVAQMQSIFLEDWLHTTGEVLHGDAHFPALPLAGEQLAQAISSTRHDQASVSKLMVYMAIQAARRRIWIANAYFVPDAQIRTALKNAAHRGVDVRIITPGANTDFAMLRNASRFYQADLIKHGIKIYEYQPTMMHSKAMVVDSIWSTIGSINLNARSFKKNAEANVMIYDYKFAEELERALAKDMEQSREITLEEVRRRGPCAHLREFWSSLFSERY
ncbi:MAG: phospholipase D-like domain-containing protein [Verrucomicrobiae bacterium]|nr:phospholipase D-like domain-containing protein [Verrucomicrobiae bacterium]